VGAALGRRTVTWYSFIITFNKPHYSKQQSLADNEIALQYRVRQGSVKFASNEFFFQEGRAEDFNAARFAQFRVNDKGELLLVAMFDKNLIQI
jgi:uncharacterized membrane-anchored protein